MVANGGCACVVREIQASADTALQVVSIEGSDEASLSTAMQEIKVSLLPLARSHHQHTTALQSLFSDVPDGIVQEPFDAEMSRSGGWKGKILLRRQSSRSPHAHDSCCSSSPDPLFQHLDTPLPRLIERVDGVRCRSQQGVGVIETGDFSRGGVPLDAFEYFAVMRGEHGARWERRRARVRVSVILIARAPRSMRSWLMCSGRWRPFDHVDGGSAFAHFLQNRPVFAGDAAAPPPIVAPEGRRWGLD